MALDLTKDCTFTGPALPEAFVLLELEAHLQKAKLLSANTGEAGTKLQETWSFVRRKLRDLGDYGGTRSVCSHLLEPLAEALGFSELTAAEEVETREGSEPGGFLLRRGDGHPHLRAWALPSGSDFDAPSKRGYAYRFSPSRVAERVLTQKQERIGLLTDGRELRVVLCDPARRDSHITIRLDRGDGGWRGRRDVPDSFRLLLALASPKGIAAIPDLTEKARLAQTKVTSELRKQAKSAILEFIQATYDDGRNAHVLAGKADEATAKTLWHEGLIVVYRLLFVLKLEASADPARAFSFASQSIWRNVYSPYTALAKLVELRRKGVETGAMLGDGLRSLFRIFREGLSSSEIRVSPLGGMLFGTEATPLLDQLVWPEIAVASLLDNLLWTARGRDQRQRVHYGSLDVEDLGRVYEALLELEPGIATEPMCRLRRAKLEVVVPIAQGDPYRKNAVVASDDAEDQEEADEEEDDDAPRKGKTKVEWIEEIHPGRFYLRVGLGRKATGSYYTPDAFVRFLVQETLGPQVAERSPNDDPNPQKILELKVLDPAMGSGHFLVGACRFLGDKLYESCRLCDEKASELEERAAKSKDPAESQQLRSRATELRKRVEDLPDPNDELVAYLPSRVQEGSESGVSQSKAQAIARRLVAVHCLYGVDKNPLAVELAKLSLWLESYAEGLPLTFLDHRLICGDSLTGPFVEHLFTFPGSGKSIEELHSRGLSEQLSATLKDALVHVRDLEASVGKDEADLAQKRVAKARLDAALAPFKTLAAAWTGGVMLGSQACDDSGYEALFKAVAERRDVEGVCRSRPSLAEMVDVGLGGVAYEFVFPEAFHPAGRGMMRTGFHSVVGNPPWDAIKFNTKEFLASFDLRAVESPTKRERDLVEARLTSREDIRVLLESNQESFERHKRSNDRLFEYQKVTVAGDLAGRQLDAFRVFAERSAQMIARDGHLGLVLPSGFHANAGCVGIRRMFLERMNLRLCYSFENARHLFEITASIKFDLVVAQSGSDTQQVAARFFLHDPEWLFGARTEELVYSRRFIEKSGGEYVTFLELQSRQDEEVAAVCMSHAAQFSTSSSSSSTGGRLQLGNEAHMANDARRFTPTSAVLVDGLDPRDPEHTRRLLAAGFLLLHEGKTFGQYSDRWDERPRYLVALGRDGAKDEWVRATRYFRCGLRAIIGFTEEKSIGAMFCAGAVFGNSVLVEKRPESRPNAFALTTLSLTNALVFDWNLRQRTAANVNLFILNGCPVPTLTTTQAGLLAHAGLRLSCNHEGYAPLWREQLGDLWHEPTPRHTWPVLPNPKDRWRVRAAIDAVVAEAYGLSRDQYAHVLASFSHRSFPDAPSYCLGAFDELKSIGLEAFSRKHDPYWDIPLVETLPKPVIELPMPGGGTNSTQPDNYALTAPAAKPGRGRKGTVS